MPFKLQTGLRFGKSVKKTEKQILCSFLTLLTVAC